MSESYVKLLSLTGVTGCHDEEMKGTKRPAKENQNNDTSKSIRILFSVRLLPSDN